MPLLGTRGAASVRGFGMFGRIPEPPPTVIGQPFGGGFYAGQISTSANGVPTQYIVVAPKAVGEASIIPWKTTSTATTGTDSVINGPVNSGNMNNQFHPAAQFCESLSINGFGDWYMPSRDELEVCYFNLKPGIILNDTASGSNVHSVPSRPFSYATDNPLQTSVALFQTGGSEAFEATSYWASTQFSGTDGWRQEFDTGLQSGANKQSQLYVRAVRRVPV